MISLGEQIDEIKRELKQRSHVYPRLVATGKLRQSIADYQVARMEAALQTLQQLNENNTTLIKNAQVIDVVILNEAGLISVECEPSTKTVTFVYEPGATYDLDQIIAYAEDMAERILIYEGETLAMDMICGESGWEHAP